MCYDFPMQDWQVGKLIKKEMAASDVTGLIFSLPRFQKAMAGQHYDIRLTAEGGYVAERSYSLASPPEEVGVAEFGVQFVENGEVSGYLRELSLGAEVEMRGPLGGHFVWCHTMPGPLVLIGGGSGMVPLMSMLRHHVRNFVPREVIFLVSAKTVDRILYREELLKYAREVAGFRFVEAITDMAPEGFGGYTRRVDLPMLKEVFGGLAYKMPMAYICGRTGFVEAVTPGLIQLGFNSHEIKTERFG